MIWCGSPASVSYKAGKNVRPRRGCGPLCVFTTRSLAMVFKNTWAGGRGGLVVYRCEYRPSKHINVWAGNMDKYHLSSLPQGTRLASQVCLTAIEERMDR